MVDQKQLFHAACQARLRAYTPYSRFKVGAALLTKQGKIYLGCNIENSAYGSTNCAERTAFFTAVCEGEREFEAICIVGGAEGQELVSVCSPCGACRQVMAEFCSPDFTLIFGKDENDLKTFTLGQVLPLSFDEMKGQFRS